MRSRYEAGFTACVAEVGRYLTSVDVVPQLSAILPRLVNHLASCLQRRRLPDRRYVTTSTTHVDDQSSPTHHQRQTQNDYDCRRLSIRQQSSDDLTFSFLQASGFNTYLDFFVIYISAPFSTPLFSLCQVSLAVLTQSSKLSFLQ